MQTIDCKLSLLQANTGQVPGLPGNPRQWTQEDVIRLAASIEQTPELLEARPIIAVQHDGKYIVLGGNLRLAALTHLKRKTAPVYVVPSETPAEKLKEIVVKDNGSFGSWDYDALANEWDDLPLTDWGVPAWDAETELQRQMNKGGLSSEGREGAEGYDEFVDKFKQKLTTDDCYTPTDVYEVVRQFVDQEVAPLEGRKVVRPFYPGGDYEKLDQYPEGCVVLDNPPFSILSKILRFYSAHQIPFFLFGPSLTLFSAADCDLTYIVAHAQIEYENGAVVSTGFITNLLPDLRIWVCPQLGEAVEEAQAAEDKTKRGFVYPDNLVTAAILCKLAAHATELKIRKRSCEYINESDSAKEQGRNMYGGGFILSDYAAAERAAAERAAATRLNLSERERAIIARLNEQDID